MYKAYISGPLTGVSNLEELKLFYESVAGVCVNVGIDPYVPHLRTDPIKNGNITPEEVYETDKAQVLDSDLLISYVGMASLGVGMEIAYAESNEISVILMYEKGKVVSRFPRGVPTLLAEIVYGSHEDALRELQTVLEAWVRSQRFAELFIEVNRSPRAEIQHVKVSDRGESVIAEKDISEPAGPGFSDLLESLADRGISPRRIYVEPFSDIADRINTIWKDAEVVYDYH